MLLNLLAAVQPTVPATPAWSPTVGIIMAAFCVLGLIVANNAVERPGVGAKLPFTIPGLNPNFSLGQFVGGMAFGHILGAGAILGLTNLGLF